MPRVEPSRVVVGAALIGVKVLRGLMWLMAVAVVGCVVSTAIGETSTVVSLGDSSARRLAPSALPIAGSVHLLRTPELSHPFQNNHHRGV